LGGKLSVGSVLDLKKQDGAPMLMVGVDAAEVERQLRARELACPDCDASLAPWGWAEGRRLRGRDGIITRGARRSRCTAIGTTHVLLPVSALRRRLDASETIVLALTAHARGMGQRRVAILVGRSEWTVRGWLRRARLLAAAIRDHFTRLGHERFGCDLRLEPLSTPLKDALNVIGVVAKAASQQLGPGPVWHFVAGATNGDLICNTSALFTQAPAGAHAHGNAVTASVIATTAACTEGNAANEERPP
jgi:hypothetical protein